MEELIIPENFGPLWASFTIILTIGLTGAIRETAQRFEIAGRVADMLVPTLAVLIAVFFRALLSEIGQEPFTWNALVEGMGAGAGAVLVHSQSRALKKRWADVVQALFSKDEDK